MFPFPPLLVPPLVAPLELALGFALGWMLRGRAEPPSAASREAATK